VVGETEEEKIVRLDAQGWSRNQIAAELGGKRAATLAKIRQVLEESEGM
jgi:DNA-binding NarL/FixJ family response regulator